MRFCSISRYQTTEYRDILRQLLNVDPTSYLPATAESTRVQERLTDFTGGAAVPAVVVLTRSDGTALDIDTYVGRRPTPGAASRPRARRYSATTCGSDTRV